MGHKHREDRKEIKRTIRQLCSPTSLSDIYAEAPSSISKAEARRSFLAGVTEARFFWSDLMSRISLADLLGKMLTDGLRASILEEEDKRILATLAGSKIVRTDGNVGSTT